MASHDDRDAPVLINQTRQALDDLLYAQEKANELTERGLNLITVGVPGEETLFVKQVGTIFLRRLPEDPIALRVSIGEGHKIDESAYCVFRGDPQDVIELLERALGAMKATF